MKKIAFILAPFLAITLLTSCNNGPKLYRVTFNTGEGGSEVPSQTVEEKKCATKPDDPTREDPDDKHGYVFNNWQLDNQPFDFATPITKDITLEANWNLLNKYRVTFNTDGGSPIAPQKVLENHLIVKPADPTHGPKDERTAYAFKEWQLEGKTFNFSTPITKDIELKAIWLEQTREYDITFNPGAGKWEKGSTEPIVKKVKYGDIPTCENPIKSSDDQYDYIFTDWMPKITKVTGPKMYTAIFGKLEKNATNLIVDFPSDADNTTITFNYEGTLDSVDWGDGEVSNEESSHKYKNVGKYTINVHGALKSISLSNEKLYSNGNKYVKNIKLKEGITSIFIPNSVTRMGGYVFKGCSGLTEIRCQAKEKPANWNDNWYGDVDPKIIKWNQPQ